MTRPATALFLASMLIASAAFAGTDINKCVSASGQVTLTDEVCPGDTQSVKVSNGVSDSDDGEVAVAPRIVNGVEHYKMAHLPARAGAPLRATPPARGLALDVATLKNARAHLQLVDAAAQHAPRLAGLQ